MPRTYLSSVTHRSVEDMLDLINPRPSDDEWYEAYLRRERGQVTRTLWIVVRLQPYCEPHSNGPPVEATAYLEEGDGREELVRGLRRAMADLELARERRRAIQAAFAGAAHGLDRAAPGSIAVDDAAVTNIGVGASTVWERLGSDDQ